MLKRFVQIHKVSVSILLFLCFIGIIHISQPGLIYNSDGSFREFGVGYKNKTVLPIWVFSIVLAIFSYLAVLYYISFM